MPYGLNGWNSNTGETEPTLVVTLDNKDWAVEGAAAMAPVAPSTGIKTAEPPMYYETSSLLISR